MLRDFLSIEIRRLGDPRLELVTITGCDVSPDLKNAWVYWSVLTLGAAPGTAEAPDAPPQSSPEQREVIEEALNGASNLLKRKIGKELGLRFTPALVFRHDHSLETSSRIEFLVKRTGAH